MADLNTLLKSVRRRRSRSGIITADRYFREVEGCFDGGFCPVKVAGAESQEQWQKALKEAETKLTYSTRRTLVLPKSVKASKSDDFIAEFDCVVTTPRRDRDRDVLETKGAKVDPNLPLLMQHVSMMPIGKRLKTLVKSDRELRFRAGIADCELGRDNLGLVKAGVLRISHGFTPIEFEPMKDEEGWHFKQFEIYEFSLVSIPSNVDAVVTSFSEKNFETDLMRGWYDSMRRKSGTRKASTATVPEDIKASDTPEPEPVQEHEQDTSLPTFEVGERLSAEKMNNLTAAIKDLQDSAKAAEPVPRTFDDIQREYIAELAKSDTDAVRKAHRILSLILRSREEQEEAKEWDEFLSHITTPAQAGSL